MRLALEPVAPEAIEDEAPARCTPKELAQRQHAVKVCGDYIMGIADVLIGTSTTTMSKQYRGTFGKDAPINVMWDEAGKEIEARIWAPLGHLTNASNIVAIFLAGDHFQTRPLSISATGSPLINEMGPQGRLSYLARSLQADTPHVRLNVQTRMDEHIAVLANAITYDFYYESADIPDEKPRSLKPFDAFSVLAGYRFNGYTASPTNPLACFGLDNRNSWMEKDGISGSRSNESNVNLILHAVIQLYKHCPRALKDLCIQTPYSSQVEMIRDGLRRPAKTFAGAPRYEDLGLVMSTFDAFQSKEALYVITNLTNTDNLGFTSGDWMMTTAITRARRLHCIIANMDILAGDQWDPVANVNDSGERFTTKNPNIITMLQYMHKANLMFPVDTTKLPDLYTVAEEIDDTGNENGGDKGNQTNEESAPVTIAETNTAQQLPPKELNWDIPQAVAQPAGNRADSWGGTNTSGDWRAKTPGDGW